ncbi:hypothetical protein JHK85_040986 [Glycine max]|nr:hypothetical protein JHK87_040211 [Glycine soja]KAG4963533.1 hypothetical protein JHK86_040401 [Glycine max]KAG4966011.1 hypothetical protein JHK85_040986 [Glycine max]
MEKVEKWMLACDEERWLEEYSREKIIIRLKEDSPESDEQSVENKTLENRKEHVRENENEPLRERRTHRRESESSEGERESHERKGHWRGSEVREGG